MWIEILIYVLFFRAEIKLFIKLVIAHKEDIIINNTRITA